MPVTLEEMKALIQKSFPGANVDGFREERDLIKGIIVWEGFKKIDYLERSKMVDEKVRDPLGLRGLNVDIIYPLAPKEKL